MTSALIAITRGVSPSIAQCELTHLARSPIDHARAVAQHDEYCRVLAELGCEVVTLPADPDLPDCVFVEDIVVVVDECAVMMRPGVKSRHAEAPAIENALRPHRPIVRIQEPGTLDGGDVLQLGRRILVGRGKRTNDAGIEQLRAHLAPHGYAVEAIDISRCLHLKSACTQVGPETVLINRDWIDAGAFSDLTLIDIDPAEPYAGNALRVGETVLHSTAFPRTRQRLVDAGVEVRTIDATELAKAEGGVTCCAVVVEKGRGEGVEGFRG